MTRRTVLLLHAALVAAVLVVGSAAALVMASQKAEATFPGKNGKIAYVTSDGHDDEIYTINPDGGGKFQVTNNDTNDYDPCYSPDGKKLAYTGYNGLGSDDGIDYDHEIYTINIGGGGKFQVTASKYYASQPSWGIRP